MFLLFQMFSMNFITALAFPNLVDSLRPRQIDRVSKWCFNIQYRFLFIYHAFVSCIKCWPTTIESIQSNRTNRFESIFRRKPNPILNRNYLWLIAIHYFVLLQRCIPYCDMNSHTGRAKRAYTRLHRCSNTKLKSQRGKKAKMKCADAAGQSRT